MTVRDASIRQHATRLYDRARLGTSREYAPSPVYTAALQYAAVWEYALAAQRNFETYGTGAAQDAQKTKQLIAQIEQAIAKGASS